jgi:hypothetical protein
VYTPSQLETGLNNAQLTVIAVLLWGYALWFTVSRLQRRRPGLDIGRQVGVGFGLRLLSIAAVTATGLGSTLRGGDEITFLDHARLIAGSSFASSAWAPGGRYGLHEILFALQMRLGDFGTGTMRITQVGLAMLGTTLLIAAVHDLGGPRAASVSAWLMALEPSSIFFSEVLHKEPLMILASGLVAFGGVKTWEKIAVPGLATMLAGGLIGVATRPYAGWFLCSAAVLLTLHASVRHIDRQRARSVPALLGVLGVIFVATPAVLAASTHSSLQANLQQSQNTNALSAGTPGNNLALEQVDFSTRGAIITNLPQRVYDLLVRPYPWQIGSTSQQVGVAGTLIALGVLALLVRYALRVRGRLLTLAGPLLYPMIFLMLAYALSVGNAGTGFRYRTHLITLAIGTLMLLRERVRADSGSPAAARAPAVTPVRYGRDSLRRPLGTGP